MSNRRRTCRLICAATLFVAAGCATSKDDGFTNGQHHDTILDDESQNFQKAKDPTFTAETRFAAGQLAESQGNTKRAIEQYTEALKLDPKHLNSLFRVGVLYTETNAFDQAINVWQHYVIASGESPNAYANLGRCYDRMNKTGEAEAAFKMGVAKDGSNEPCRVNYGLMLVRVGRVVEGAQQLAVVLSPADVHYDIASVFEMQGKRAQAHAEYLEALKSDPDMRDARVRMQSLEQAKAE